MKERFGNYALAIVISGFIGFFAGQEHMVRYLEKEIPKRFEKKFKEMYGHLDSKDSE